MVDIRRGGRSWSKPDDWDWYWPREEAVKVQAEAGRSQWLRKLGHNFELLVISFIVASILLLAWISASMLEAQAFERVTGRRVSTWDAMWLQLVVQEPASRDSE